MNGKQTYELPKEKKKSPPPPPKKKLPEPYKGSKLDWLNDRVTELQAPIMYGLARDAILQIETNMSKAIEGGT